MRAVAQEVRRVEIGGEICELSTSDLLIVMLQRRALNGDYGAKRLLDEVREKYGVPDDSSGLPAIVAPKRLEMDEFQVVAAAARKRMLWAQEQRLKDDAAAKQTAASSDSGSEPLKQS